MLKDLELLNLPDNLCLKRSELSEEHKNVKLTNLGFHKQ